MGLLAYDKDTNRMVRAEEKSLVEQLLKIKESKPMWDVIAFIVNVWRKSKPDEWDSYIVHLDAVKSDQKKKYVGRKRFRGVSRSDSIERSHVLDVPHWIFMMIKILYREEEFWADEKKKKAFYRKFADKFPIFRIREQA